MLGGLAKWIGQPAVLGELVAGVILGTSCAGLVNPQNEIIQFLAEIGVVILLFEIGLETDLRELLRVGAASIVVAVVGVALPFALGYAAMRCLGQGNLVATVVGATLTATSVGITARVLSDLGRLQEPESRIVLGAAVIDDVIGLIILAVVAGLTAGREFSVVSTIQVASVAIGFLAATLLLGSIVLPPLARLAGRIDLPGTPTVLAVILAFGLAWLASIAGSAMIIGAFSAGLLLRRVPAAQEIEKGIASLGHIFVPLFFVKIGAAVDVSILNPLEPANGKVLLTGALLIVAAVIGKFVSGYAPFWFAGDKRIIGIGMIPRGEVGLIFAQMGLASGTFDAGLFSAITLMVMVTTFIAPPLLKRFAQSGPSASARASDGIEELVMDP
jgi:Kef-type K+ transport system membrane component KefB